MNNGAKLSSLDVAALVAIFFLQVALRLWWVVSNGHLERAIYPDEISYYLSAAAEIAAHGSRYFLTPRSLWNGPVNPLWIFLWGSSIPLIKILNIGLVSLGGILLWDILRRLVGRQPAYLALAAYSAFPPLFVFSGTLLTEPLFVTLLVLSFWLLVVSGFSVRGGLASGAIFGLAILTRPTAQLFPFVALVIAIHTGRSRSRGKNVSAGLYCFALAAVLFVFPYAAKNYIVFDELKIANGMGAVLFLGNDLRMNGDEPIYSDMDFDTYEITAPHTHLDSEGDRRLRNAAFDKIRAHPGTIVTLTAQKVFRFLFGYPQHYFYPYYDVVSYAQAASKRSALWKLFEIFLTGIIVVAGVAGFFFSPLPSAVRLLLGAFAAYFVVLHAAAFPIPRLALPVFPVLLVSAAGLVAKAGRKALIALLTLACISSAYISIGQRGTHREIVSDQYRHFFSEQHEISALSPEGFNDVRIDGDVIAMAGADPFLTFRTGGITTRRNQLILIEMKAWLPNMAREPESSIQVFWSRDAVDAFTEQQAARIGLKADGEFHWYRVNPSKNPLWTGNIEGLRLDFESSHAGMNFALRRLLVVH